MDHTKIQSLIETLISNMGDKGLVSPDVSVVFQANHRVAVLLNWKKQNGTRGDKGFYGQCLENALHNADSWVAGLPEPQEAAKNDAIRAIATAIELSKAAGLAPEFFNPLEEMMVRLSENVITDQRPQNG